MAWIMSLRSMCRTVMARLWDWGLRSGCVQADTVDLDLAPAQELVQAQALNAWLAAEDQSLADQRLDEPMEVAVSLEERPVEPADLVVLAVGIVVASLRPPDLVAHRQHRRAQR